MGNFEKVIISIIITFIVSVGIGLSLQDIINYEIVFVLATIVSLAVGFLNLFITKQKAKI